jgi:hypothetical protein
MKHSKVASALVFALLVMLSTVLNLGMVSAQASYRIDQVDHNVEIMYSGHIVIRDTIYISGQTPDSFLIGLPHKYSANILKALAFDENNIYQMSLGVQLGDRTGFYASKVNFDGKSPNVFTVVFVLSNRLISEQNFGSLTLDFPAYPSFITDVARCNVNIIFPSAPTGITIIKDDGEVNTISYVRDNLPAYTYSLATASFQLPVGALQLTKIDELNRHVTISAAGVVTSSDSYRITNNSTTSMRFFPITMPADASNFIAKDEFGRALETIVGAVNDNALHANVSLISLLNSGQSTTITAEYNLLSATKKDGYFILKDFNFFQNSNYYVESYILTIIPPEGAMIISPQLYSLDPFSSLTRNSFQETLTITKSGISYIDQRTFTEEELQLTYNYNPVWVSFRPTFWASLLAMIGCVAIFMFKKRSHIENGSEETSEEISRTISKALSSPTIQQLKAEVRPGARISNDEIRNFIELYENFKRVNSDIKTLDISARKGRIPRRQYKVQRKVWGNRLQSLHRDIVKLKAIFRSSGGTYGNFVNQIDSAEADLVDVEENMRSLEFRYGKGEITIDIYKKKLADFQLRKEKAESIIKGILIRLREKLY